MGPRTPLLIAALCLTCITGCERQDSLDTIQSRGELIVVSRNSPTTYYLDKNGATGFEYAMTELLAQELEVDLELRPAFSLGGIFKVLRRSEADLAAAGLTLTERRAKSYPHSIAYGNFVPRVVYLAGNPKPREPGDLLGQRIVVLAGSSHAEDLRALKKNEFPDLLWEEIPEADAMELLELVNAGLADLAIVNSNEFRVQQSLYPRIKVGFDLGSLQDMVWYFPPGIDNTRLLVKINALIQRLQSDGTLERLRELHFGHIASGSRMNSHTFNLNMRSDLPKYQSLIQQVASEYRMDWNLLAAIAYQESHWDPKATSPTGVRGMMMLTERTAKEVGVQNRLNAAQSLRGGARYLKNLKRRMDKDIPEPDRTWMALAAYNIGIAHLEDVRKLTERQGGDPNQWQAVVTRLPLLQKRKYYDTTRYGYARGLEAVTYVQNIRHYQSILAWQAIPENKVSPPLRMDEYLPETLHGVGMLAL